MAFINTRAQIDAAKVGDACYVQSFYGTLSSKAVIAAISPTKRITIDFGLAGKVVFRPKRYASGFFLEEGNADASFKRSLELDVMAVESEMAKIQLRKDAAAALDAIACPSAVRYTWTKEAMLEHLVHIESLVTDARNAVEKL